MEDFIIIVNQIEELQAVEDRQQLEVIFERAKRTIVGGMDVVLVRENKGKQERFDTITNEQDLEAYKHRVFRFL